MKTKYRVGFIGQGWIGKHYANDFEARGYEVVRYSQEEPYIKNKDHIKDCDIVFIAVPTPTTPAGFIDAIVRSVVKHVGKGKIAVIKSTIPPGTTESIQKENPDIFVFHSPEFLSIATAAEDAAHPKRNIVGMPVDSEDFRKRAEMIMSVLPQAPYSKICHAREAEIIKYGRNCVGYARVLFSNVLYDLAKNVGADWETIQEAMSADPDNGPTYMNPLHKSGRGAGGDCFIKDFAAFTNLYTEKVHDPLGQKMLRAMESKNIELLKSTRKDLKLLEGVYGKETAQVSPYTSKSLWARFTSVIASWIPFGLPNPGRPALD
jgi:nucleotide sugar dehydrogenase